MKKAFTLIEMVIVLLVIWILLAATMKFGSNRIIDLKAQSIKEQFVGYYNDIYSQNMTSSFRDGKKYQQLVVVLTTGISYSVDALPLIDSKISGMSIQNLRFETEGMLFPLSHLLFVPYQLWCGITDGTTSWNILYFNLVIPENGKQYCFEIKSETCKLVEQHCND
ncbi:MAG: hypothetical protein ACD_80C00016G0002 [uncultured bacterium (gcode 4)]|uniref:Prepilin-type N-terminal cleavage/methylation domain-containing protein n=1 Tax=uncultured bacterium (gcode 4) TaxID=1234023 RepID=K1X5R6_9BACT|nr:MAG: hypothetical protein ACD_80C00016G0002 [uncultured bacterium (gcode 4)]